LEPNATRIWKKLTREERVSAATLFWREPSEEVVAAALLVALHLGERRSMLVAFLDAAGLAHEDGILREEDGAAPPLGEDAARAGVRALAAAYPREQVVTYLNTLWLQDPERWRVLEHAPGWL
jgi:hypothetical protein